jgi:hypothetical protein
MLESTIAPKQEKPSHLEQTQLVQLVMSKNEELKDYLGVRINKLLYFGYFCKLNVG